MLFKYAAQQKYAVISASDNTGFITDSIKKFFQLLILIILWIYCLTLLVNSQTYDYAVKYSCERSWHIMTQNKIILKV